MHLVNRKRVERVVGDLAHGVLLLAVAGVMIVLLGMLGGCGGMKVAYRPVNGEKEETGGRGVWESVFSPPGYVTHDDAPAWRRPEYSRRDDALAVREPEPVLATNQWPERAGPSVFGRERFHLSRNPRSILIFVPDVHRHHRYYKRHRRHGRLYGHGY